MVEDHVHSDRGHSHADAGHSHVDAGHGHLHNHLVLSGAPFSNGGDHYTYPVKARASTTTSKANIQASKANIQSSKSNIGGMANGSKGTETRPINMRVLWIMKAW